MGIQQRMIQKIFESQGENKCWKMLPESHKYYPDYLHYVPNFKATLWTLILLADIQHDPHDVRVKKPLEIIRDHFYDPENRIYTLKKDHFPIPCLNGNMIYLENYFNGSLSEQSAGAIDFFFQYQRFDDGEYLSAKNEYCSNTSCYGKHTCYWGIIKLLKGLSFIPQESRTASMKTLLNNCMQFILLHHVCFSSHHKDKIMIKHMDKLTFPNMYKSDFLEILWLLKRENIRSDNLRPAIDLLQAKRLPNGNWNLERKINNMITSAGELNQPNPFVTKRAKEVIDYYDQ